MLSLALVVSLLLATRIAESRELSRASPDDVFSVYRLLPKNQQQFRLMQGIYQNATRLDLNFWKTSKEQGGFWDVMADAKAAANLLKMISSEDIEHMQTIKDVEHLIKSRESGPSERRLNDDVSGKTYNFQKYGSYAQMVSWMRHLARSKPDLVQFISVGKSHEGRSIDGLEIGRGDISTKRVFWIDAGIHAREWAAHHTALYFIHQLTSRADSDPQISAFLDTITFVIVPCLNPDGYEFTRSSQNPHIRLWRKNRSGMTCFKDDWGRNRCCRGVDLNRNFDFHFKESGSSDDPCSEIYQGKSAFSEPETQAVRDAIMSRRYRGRMDGYVTLHTYSQIWIHPYGHKKDAYPGDIQELYDVGKRAARALQDVHGTKYIVGSGADTLYPASGGSEDWAKRTGKVKFVYLLELRPDEKNWDGFILDEKELIPTAAETWAGMKVVADAIVERKRLKSSQTTTTLAPHRFGDGTEGSCYDLRHACKRWIQQQPDLCKTVPVFMREQCAYSCGHC